jgi:hypothetical protein
MIAWAGIAASAFLLLACAGLGKGRDFTPYAPTGLVVVVSNADINWLGEDTYETGSAVSDFVRQKLGLEREKATVRVSRTGDLINEADSMLRKIINEAVIFRLEDKDRLLSTASYAAAENSRVANQKEKIAATGYRNINYRDKNFAGSISRETGIQSLLYVTFEFNKEMASGIAKIGKCRARVLLSALLVNPAGKVVYRKDIETHSRDKIPVSDGAYVEEELIELLKEAIGEACYRFVWDFTGVPKT